MGAEQVGFLVVGPMKIAARKIKAAVRACKQRRQELLAQADGDANRQKRMDAALSETGEYFDPEDIPENPELDIRSFGEWWHTLDCRDTCSRTDPDDPRQKIVYAGEMSCGDEPEGHGYQQLKKALAWGFAKALGIR